MYNIDAEQGLLGAILYDNGCIYDADCQPEDFYQPVHGEIFAKCQKMISDNKTVTPVTLKQAFDNHPDLQDVGGAAYIVDLLAGVVSTASVPDYSETIRDMADRRRMIAAINEAKLQIESSDISIADIRADFIHNIEQNSPESTVVKTKKQVADDILKNLELPPNSAKTGLLQLDRAMSGGLYQGFTYGLAGAEKSGKTTFAHTISYNLNEAGENHAYVALEMGSTQIEQRNLARKIGVNSLEFLKPTRKTEFVRSVVKHAAECKDNTLYLDMPGSTFVQIKSELSRLIAKGKIKGFIIDYWQLVSGSDRNQSKADFYYQVAQGFANFARKQKVWCILLAQVNRQGNVFGSAGLEKACDQLYFIEKAKFNEDTDRYLELTHSRYTPLGSIGSCQDPAFKIASHKGPYIDEI